MAFATSNVSVDKFGAKRVTVGDWSGSAGDATGTIVVEGGRVYHAYFSIQDTDTPTMTPVPISVSGTSGQITISVYNHDDVTTGRFFIVHA